MQKTKLQQQLAKSKRTALEDAFLKSCKVLGLPEPIREYQFHSPRRWRFDFAWRAYTLISRNLLVAAEVEGGTWANGRHNRGKGYEEDCRKYNQAALDGWRVFRFTADMVKSMEAATVVKEALGL